MRPYPHEQRERSYLLRQYAEDRNDRVHPRRRRWRKHVVLREQQELSTRNSGRLVVANHFVHIGRDDDPDRVASCADDLECRVVPRGVGIRVDDNLARWMLVAGTVSR